MSQGEAPSKKSIWFALVIAAISGGAISGSITGIVSYWQIAAEQEQADADREAAKEQADADREKENVQLVLEIYRAELGVDRENAAFYGALMTAAKTIPQDLGCSLAGFAAKGGEYDKVVRSVAAALRQEALELHFSRQPCDFASYVPTMENVAGDGGTRAPPVGTLKCPTGSLFTQFGDKAQIDFGAGLRRIINPNLEAAGGSVSQPEWIDGFDGDKVFVRYFFPELEEDAIEWADYLEATIPDTEIRYVFLDGFQDRMSEERKKTFELWWPASKQVPAAALENVSCESS